MDIPSMDTLWPSKPELLARTENLQKLLAEDGLDGAIFYQNMDLVYFCGTTQAQAVFVPVSGPPLALARRPLGRIKQETSLDHVAEMPPSSSLFSTLQNHAQNDLQRLGLELDVLPVNFFERLKTRVFPDVQLEDVSAHVRNLRMVKSEFELGMMAKAAEQLDYIYSRAPEILKPGMTEVELEGRLFALAKTLGHHGVVRGRGFNMEIFFGHLLSGTGSLEPAKVDSPTGGLGVGPGLGQGASHRIINPGELVSIDYIGAFGGYMVDQARLFHTGPAPQILTDTYEALKLLVERLNDFIRPGKAARDVYSQAQALAGELGLADGFMGLGDFRCSFVGHGIGLELDELPVLGRTIKAPLVLGATYALEPRVFLPDIGVVGIEDTYVLEPDGPKPITFTSRDLIEI